MTKVLCFSGKKQSGKNTSCNFLVGLNMLELGLIKDFHINVEGKLCVVDHECPENAYKMFDPLSRDPEVMAWSSDHIWGAIKVYSFADILKELVVYLFKVDHNLVFGIDKDKNQGSGVSWEQLPVGPSLIYAKRVIKEHAEKSGELTIRQLLQYVGTELFRGIRPTIWIDLLLERIQKESPELALICDCRFPDEVENVQKFGGKVIRLTLNDDSKDNHSSETALNREVFDWSKFDYVLDNKDKTIEESNNLLVEKLKEWE